MRLDAGDTLKLAFTPQDETYVYALFKWRFEDAIDVSNRRILQVFTGGSSSGMVYVYASGTIKALAYGGTITASLTTTISEDNNLWFKLRAKEGTGTDTELCVSVWTGSAWESYLCSSDGTRTGDIDSLKFENTQDEAGEYQYVEAVTISSADFTADPE